MLDLTEADGLKGTPYKLQIVHDYTNIIIRYASRQY